MAGRDKSAESDTIERDTWDLRSKGPKQCEAHWIPLQEGVAQIIYGLLEFDESYLSDRKDLFPNARSWVGGGCVTMDMDMAEVDFCLLCREAETVWEQVKRLLSTP